MISNLLANWNQKKEQLLLNCNNAAMSGTTKKLEENFLRNGDCMKKKIILTISNFLKISRK